LRPWTGVVFCSIHFVGQMPVLMSCICGDIESYQAHLLPVHKFKKTDERSASALDHAEPLISFALCCGSRSSPVVSSTSTASLFLLSLVLLSHPLC
jgi:hypothetical protein